MRRPTLVELGQVASAGAIVAGLFLLLPLAWFLFVVGWLGVTVLTLAEYVAKLAPKPTPAPAAAAPETDGA